MLGMLKGERRREGGDQGNVELELSTLRSKGALLSRSDSILSSWSSFHSQGPSARTMRLLCRVEVG